jgi:uncharacterized Zn-finger protein
MSLLFSNTPIFAAFLQEDFAFDVYACQKLDCVKSYTRPSELVAHRRCHDEEKGHVCEWPGCEMWFKYSEHLCRHKITHIGGKQHKHEICMRNFSRSDHLKVHKKIHSRGVTKYNDNNNRDIAAKESICSSSTIDGSRHE